VLQCVYVDDREGTKGRGRNDGSVLQCVTVCVASSITSVLQCVRKERRVENVLDHHNEVDFNQRETSHTQMMSSRIGF